MGTLILWLLTIVLIAAPVGYVALHWSTQTIREAALTGWFGTVIGVVVGVPVALWLVRMQQRAQSATETARQLKEHQEALALLRLRVLDEVVFNLDQVGILGDVLRKSPTARADVWIWARRVVESFEVGVRQEFERLALSPMERVVDAPVELAYRDLRRLATWVKRAEAAHAFFYGFSANEAAANMQLSEVQNYVGIVTAELTAAREQLRKGEEAA